MILTEENDHGDYRINAYQPGKIIVNQTSYTGSIVISPTILIDNWTDQPITELTEQHLETITALKPDLVLLGTGKQLVMPKPTLLLYFQQRGIGIECMHTFSACTTFTALSAEKRNVVAALLIS